MRGPGVGRRRRSTRARWRALGSRPEHVGPEAEASQPDDGYADPEDDMDAAFGEGAEAASLSPTAPREAVDAERERDEADDDEEEACR